ncbi:universal stress protein [Rhodococcus sp. IEGM 1366]|uniref:universal stress protein n=1 Tax=Rhodococcus sp. IEGM 1366 TaxID=3082223 RepID=UPI002953D855|nr:universal stress protein [Rhodococcus sp. IEGM 1366]MDV8070563.1 universal stress protein [Rhodococcus sp. IEGM 1366]
MTAYSKRRRFHAGRRALEPIHIDGPVCQRPPCCHLVVGVDAHPGIHPALAFAIGFARQLNAELHVVHSIDLADYPIEPDSPRYEHEFAETLESERARTCATLASFGGPWSYEVSPEDPGRLLTATANACDAVMIVIGTPRRGITSIIERISGESVLAHLIHHTHRPLLMIPDSAAFPGQPASPPASAP